MISLARLKDMKSEKYACGGYMVGYEKDIYLDLANRQYSSLDYHLYFNVSFIGIIYLHAHMASNVLNTQTESSNTCKFQIKI